MKMMDILYDSIYYDPPDGPEEPNEGNQGPDTDYGYDGYWDELDTPSEIEEPSSETE